MPRLSAPIAPAAESSSTSLGDAIDRWMTYLRGSDRIGSQRTITAYQYGVGKLVAALGSQYEMHSISQEDIEAMLGDLKRGGMSPAGRMAVYAPLRTFFGWATKRGLLTTNPMADVEAPVVRAQPVEFVSDSEWAAILATCVSRSNHDFRAVRDRAVLTMLASTGARLHEVAGLQVEDIDLRADTILVHGKGGKDRMLPLLPDAKAAFKNYLDRARPRSPYSLMHDLWLGPKGPMTDSGIAQMLAERSKAAGLKRRVHPHELRHRFIARAMSKGMPGPLVMALSGHSTPAMLNRYGAWSRAEDAMRMLREFEGKAS